MKKIPLRIRFTIAASCFLLISCIILTLLSNFSAKRMVNMIDVIPASKTVAAAEADSEDFICRAQRLQTSYRIFRKETIIATVCIVTLGSITAYLAAGYVLKPIHQLSEEMKNHNANNLDQLIHVPQSADELQQLSLSFNSMITELQRSFSTQKQFSANAAHELRTPLAVMQTKLDVFRLSSPHSEQEVNELIDSINLQLGNLSVLIEDLLWFSRDLPLEKLNPINLFPIIDDVVQELTPLAEEKKISLEINQDDCLVYGQDRLLERVFYNILENAVKYSPPYSAVQVSCRKNTESVQILISDNGETIPAEYCQAVFEPFFRLDSSRNKTVSGNGLGLAVCKKILERHHASICVSPNFPAGNIFTVSFPTKPLS